MLVLTAFALFLAYWLCFALWMTAYHREPGPLRFWQMRFYTLAVSLFVVCAADVYLLIRVVRTGKKVDVDEQRPGV